MKNIPLRSTAVALVALFALNSCTDDEDTRMSAVPENACQAVTTDGSTVVVGSNLPGDPALPEPASGYRTGLKTVYAKTFMVATSNPFASSAGCAVLKKGG